MGLLLTGEGMSFSSVHTKYEVLFLLWLSLRSLEEVKLTFLSILSQFILNGIR